MIEISRDKYLDYISEHIRNVKKAWQEVQSNLTGLDEYQLSVIDDLVENHDKSKYSESEFNHYRNYFFPYDGEEKSEAAFKKAWCHHIRENKHHWNHWVVVDADGTYAIEMPFKYIFEMLLDWKAMSYKFGNTVQSYYARNKLKMVLHENTIKTIEKWINIF